MTPVGRGVVAVLVSALAVVAIAGLSRIPFDATRDDRALVRLSWRTPGELVAECRRLSAEELERLPIHMRREEVCEGRLVPYRLQVDIDGRRVIDDTVRAAGAREDRPLYVFRELPVPPGRHRVEVLWEQVRAGEPEPGGAASADPGTDAEMGDPSLVGHRVADSRPPSAAPRRLTLQVELLLQSGEVALVTYDVDRRVLVAGGRGLVSVTAE
jgi:hypothetical protein